MPDGHQRTAPPGSSQGEPPLGWVVAAAGVRAAAGFRRALPDGLHPREFALLQHLVARDPDSPVHQRQVATELGIPPGRIVAHLDALESRGWVSRRPAAGDRRAHHLHVTEAGRVAAAELARFARDYDAALTAELNPDEQHLLRSLLARLAVPGAGEPPHVW